MLQNIWAIFARKLVAKIFKITSLVTLLATQKHLKTHQFYSFLILYMGQPGLFLIICVCYKHKFLKKKLSALAGFKLGSLQ